MIEICSKQSVDAGSQSFRHVTLLNTVVLKTGTFLGFGSLSLGNVRGFAWGSREVGQADDEIEQDRIQFRHGVASFRALTAI